MQKVYCNSCGNPLTVDSNARFVSCNRCNTALKIERTENSIYTIEPEESNTNHYADNSNANNKTDLYKQLEILDREWEYTLPDFMVKGTLPNTDSGLELAGTVVGIIFIICWIIGAAFIFWPFIFFGIAAIIGLIWNQFNHNDRIERYNNAKRAYESKRQALLVQIDKS